jgi:hypothetical protein
MSSYTPAPWTVDGTTAAENLDVIGENGRVAMLDCDDIDADTLEANARLISAAPELLAVLQDVREAWLAGRMGDVEGILTGDVCIEAINKALGDSHYG